MAPTTTVETVSVVRPIKLMALICACIGLLFLIISIASSWWLEAENYRQGLWQECNTINDEVICTNNTDKPYIVACGSLCVIAALVSLAGIILTGMGLLNKNPDTKFKLYRIAMGVMFFGVLCIVIAVIVFPICFMAEIADRGKPEWYFGWAYGLAWGSAILLTGAAVLLLIDRETDEIYFREKTYYSDA